ncbi:tetraacyldisaccharide 4'-kinase [Vibrio sp. SCSIO 43136]|uniref:tetraacyldisaccharide 4'-kinase n=1 Tax=Vibrio sp. SCSIO 43136 TaxID=2819101 RepID=UPI002074B1D0|nr:tetraacyldisaccharide 4'-kinase [Vibrio sp. SCSIO 43136]USD66210.1 tetraacyldisaccharide 4'-kinase [Vibrio sp. SCSIO 43136]
MVEAIWFNQHWLGKLLWPVLKPLSLLFGLISRKRRYQFQSGEKASYRAPLPVIVVGNITAGGNGKTPVVIWLVETLAKHGIKAGVVSRGYGAKAPHYPYVVGNQSKAEECGDEPLLIHQRTQAPVVVDPVRSNAVKTLLQHNVDVVITDDGLQHYALQRDIEIVVIDGERRFGNQELIPLGPLRESVERLNEVDFQIVNGGKAKLNEIAMQLEPTLAVNLVSGEKKPVDQLGSLVAFAAIGYPQRFFNTLTSLGAELSVTQPVEDHKYFGRDQIEALVKQQEQVIMTEKDAVKCQFEAQPSWWYLPVSAQLEDQAQQIIQKIIKVKEEYGSSST